MRTGAITFPYFNKGDFVLTPYGYGRVVEDEDTITSERELVTSEVKVQHMTGSSVTNPGNLPVNIDRASILNVDAIKPLLVEQGINVEDYFNALTE